MTLAGHMTMKCVAPVFLNETMVAIACHEPEESCFCKVFGIDCAEPAADVAAWFAGEELYWKVVTENGQ